MFIIIDKTTNKIKQTISINYGIQVAENELLQEVVEEIANKFNSAQDYELVFTDGKVTDITVNKTWEQYQSEQTPPPYIPTEQERILALEQAMNDLLMGGM